MRDLINKLLLLETTNSADIVRIGNAFERDSRTGDLDFNLAFHTFQSDIHKDKTIITVAEKNFKILSFYLKCYKFLFDDKGDIKNEGWNNFFDVSIIIEPIISESEFKENKQQIKDQIYSKLEELINQLFGIKVKLDTSEFFHQTAQGYSVFLVRIPLSPELLAVLNAAYQWRQDTDEGL